jgi:broad specificity phosphatase PhoE
MSIKITYFVHWTTLDNENEISSWWYDVELSDLWIKQSIDLKKLIDIDSFDIVFCSDLKRAVDSSNLTFSWIIPIIQDERLRECNYWIYNAKPSSIVEPMQEGNIKKKFPDWESYDDVKNRIFDFLEFLKLNYEWKKVAIVAHKAPQLALDVIIKWITWEEAFKNDWRKNWDWKPWWEYILEN